MPGGSAEVENENVKLSPAVSSAPHPFVTFPAEPFQNTCPAVFAPGPADQFPPLLKKPALAPTAT